MRVLITGAAGFLGSHLSDRFLADGHSVVGLDNFLTGHKDNIAHVASNDRFTFMRHNISEFTQVDGALDGVLHFASPASPIDYLKYPIQTLKVGSLGTHNALGITKAKGARFLLASTSEVYGDPLEHPQRETYWGNVNPIGPRGVYDEAKRFAEAITMAYHRYHGVDTRIVRIFNTYGPRMRPNDGRVVSNFIVQALRGEPLTMYGDGSQSRSFCYVEDEVEGIYRLFAKGDHDPVNIGNPVEYTVKQLADMVLELTGSKSKIEQHPLPVDDPRVRQPDITRARTLLGWEPRVDVRAGLLRTIEWFRTRIAAGVAVAAVLLTLTACGRGFQVRDYPTPVSLYAAAMDEFRLGHWQNAVTALDQVTILLGPRDSLLPRAHFTLAQALTKQKHYLLAATSYRRVVDDFPDDTLADDAVIGMADAYSSAWRGPGFDRAHATEALQSYQLLPRLFPSSPLVKRALDGEKQINEKLGRADYNSGMFYVRLKAFDSALIYFKDVVALYPGTDAARDALLKMVEIYKRLHYVADAADACRALRGSYSAGVDVVKACATVLADTTR